MVLFYACPASGCSLQARGAIRGTRDGVAPLNGRPSPSMQYLKPCPVSHSPLRPSSWRRVHRTCLPPHLRRPRLDRPPRNGLRAETGSGFRLPLTTTNFRLPTGAVHVEDRPAQKQAKLFGTHGRSMMDRPEVGPAELRCGRWILPFPEEGAEPTSTKPSLFAPGPRRRAGGDRRRTSSVLWATGRPTLAPSCGPAGGW